MHFIWKSQGEATEGRQDGAALKGRPGGCMGNQGLIEDGGGLPKA